MIGLYEVIFGGTLITKILSFNQAINLLQNLIIIVIME